jgi:murein DD-endopeptidase MepM/ murein hydrolase activator NlpD
MTSSYNPGPEFKIDGEYTPGPQFNPASGYGTRSAPKPGASTLHHGLDFRAPLDTPIPAAADGVVGILAPPKALDTLLF